MCRPWYSSAATYPKDLVIMIDKSQSMTSNFGTESRLYYAIKAAQYVLETLNPYDHVSMEWMLCFSNKCSSQITVIVTEALVLRPLLSGITRGRAGDRKAGRRADRPG